MSDSAAARPRFALAILATVKAAQNSNGLRMAANYRRYRQYCTRRLRRLRKCKKMRFMFAPKVRQKESCLVSVVVVVVAAAAAAASSYRCPNSVF
jgi:hypothetical protein